MTPHRPSAGFIMVPCKCGRMLRAKREQVGSEIVCWDCRAALVVAIPRARVRFLSVMLRAVLDHFSQEFLGRLVVASCLLVLALCVPYAGVGLAGILLLLGTVVYGERIAEGGDPGAEAVAEAGWLDRLRRFGPARWACGVAFVAGTIVPLWVLGASFHHSPHLNWASLAVLVLCWVALPVALTALSAPAESGGGPARRLDFLRAHPMLALLIVAIAPMALVASEVLVTSVVYGYGTLPLFALDFMPIPGKPLNIHGILHYDFVSYGQLPPERFNLGYFRGLRQGYSFVGSIPPSLSLDTRADISPRPLLFSPEGYLGLRVLLVGLIGLVLGLALAIQARCFNILVHARAKRAA